MNPNPPFKETIHIVLRVWDNNDYWNKSAVAFIHLSKRDALEYIQEIDRFEEICDLMNGNAYDIRLWDSTPDFIDTSKFKDDLLEEMLSPLTEGEKEHIILPEVPDTLQDITHERFIRKDVCLLHVSKGEIRWSAYERKTDVKLDTARITIETLKELADA